MLEPCSVGWTLFSGRCFLAWRRWYFAYGRHPGTAQQRALCFNPSVQAADFEERFIGNASSCLRYLEMLGWFGMGSGKPSGKTKPWNHGDFLREIIPCQMAELFRWVNYCNLPRWDGLGCTASFGWSLLRQFGIILISNVLRWAMELVKWLGSGWYFPLLNQL